ncbi:uncharacterized protein [Aegilops tauschii subsp. strangulata]|uniref:uncharacterized protein n=1 Tax=Aegilops tauschii subsp. strangulata TaxID=200361 RepID=UPI003CC8B3E4
MPRRKNYTNHYRQEVNFLVEDQVYLQATSLKRTKHFHVKRNSHQDLSTFSKITARRRIDGYQLELPPEPPTVHNIFHESQLRKCFQLPNQPDPYKDIDHRAIDLQPNMTYARDPNCNLDQAGCHTRSHAIEYFKDQWSTTRKHKQYEDVKTTPRSSFRIPFHA